MKVYKYNIGGKELVINVGRPGKIASISYDGSPLGATEEEMPRYAGVIALALLQYDAAEIHDEESGVITVETSDSQWNSPMHKLNSLNS